MQLCQGGELHSGFETADIERTAYTYGDIGRIAVCMLQLVDIMHNLGIVHCTNLLSQYSASVACASTEKSNGCHALTASLSSKYAKGWVE